MGSRSMIEAAEVQRRVTVRAMKFLASHNRLEMPSAATLLHAVRYVIRIRLSFLNT